MIDVEALKASVDIVAVVGHHVPLAKRGNVYLGRCIAHSPDNHPSMEVNPRKRMVFCNACGFAEDVIGFLMAAEHIDFPTAASRLNGHAPEWTPSITQPPPAPVPDRITSKPPLGMPTPDMQWEFDGNEPLSPSKIWHYLDADGELLGYVCRYELPDRKEYRPWTWGARGDREPSWFVGTWNVPRPLYGLNLLAERRDSRVIIVEGEKAADAVRRLLPKNVTVSWPGGAKAWQKADWRPLAGRSIIVWPDNDAAGLKAGELLARLLADPKGLACTVQLLDPNRMAEGWDAADAEAEGYTGHSLLEWAKPRLTPIGVPAGPLAPPPVVAPAPREPEAIPLPPPPRAAPTGLRLVASEGNAVEAPEHSTEILPEKLSDDALAQYFAEQHHADWQYVPEWSREDKPVWFHWETDSWRRDRLEAHYTLAREVTRHALYWPEAAGLTPASKRSINSRRQARELLEFAKRDRRIAAHNDIWDRDPWLLGVPGGTIDLRDGTTRAPSKADYITRRAAVAPVPGAHPLFDSVLACATGGDAAMAAYLWRWFGYFLTGDTREEAFLFLHGKGGSGKGTLVKALAEIMGEQYSVSCSTATFTESKQERHTQELAKLDGSRLAYASETEEGRRWNESLIKLLTGRDKIAARFMRGNDFEYVPRFKLLIYGNHRPQLKSVGEEMRRRIHLIEYRSNIPEAERDTTLKDRLVAEYPAILHSMIEGCIDWQRIGGLAKPASVDDSVSEYLEAEDTIGLWFDECAEADPAAKVLTAEAYESFRHWADREGEYAVSHKRFTAKLKDRGLAMPTKLRGKRAILGLRLKPSEVDARALPYADDEPPADWHER